MQQFIYGASVKGIQSFIFQTNKLREIVGASQLVDDIFPKVFLAFCKNHKIEKEDVTIIMSAAGNIRCIVDEVNCEKIVRAFPQYMTNYATGITVNQAATALKAGLKKDLQEVEVRLQTQVNKVAMPSDIGFMGLARARRTGGVAYQRAPKGEGYNDRATQKKIDTSKGDQQSLFKKFSGDQIYTRNIPFDIEQITKESEKGWLAIIHADGNGLGRLLRKLYAAVKKDKDLEKVLSDFSKALGKATEAAAKIAFRAAITEAEQKEIETQKEKYFPIRPVILGGDDLVVIIRADLAFKFTKEFLEAFEKTTKKELTFLQNYKIKGFEEGLTACAGIAYVKTSYPFHYGIHLAEALTDEAKRFSKNIDSERAPSSLYFYKVQSSFVEKLTKMKTRTHVAKAAGLNFDFGPYLISEKISATEQFANVKELEGKITQLTEQSTKEKAGLSKFRNWVSALHQDAGKADLLKRRMKQVNDDLYKILELEKVDTQQTVGENELPRSILQDLLILSSFNS